MKSCYYCDKHAPVMMGKDLTPCSQCERNMREGIQLVSIDFEKNKRSGFRTMVSERWVNETLTKQEQKDALIKYRFGFLPDKLWNKLGLPRTNKRLYALAVEFLVGADKWVPSVEYIHADTVEEAKFRYKASEDQKFHIVAAGQVIGYFVNDTKGDSLSVD